MTSKMSSSCIPAYTYNLNFNALAANIHCFHFLNNKNISLLLTRSIELGCSATRLIFVLIVSLNVQH
jgi:hypothetical protein